jgi:hypothetical protein
MPRDFNGFPRAELAEDLALKFSQFAAQPAERVEDVAALVVLGFEPGDLVFEFVNWFFKTQAMHHGGHRFTLSQSLFLVRRANLAESQQQTSSLSFRKSFLTPTQAC